MILTVGSGGAGKLLSGKNTKGFAKLLQDFVAEDKPYWNSKSSPIDALRTGAILEDKYVETLNDDYYLQYKATCEEFDCLVSSIDFAKLEKGNIVDFEELKTIYFTDFIQYVSPLKFLEKKEYLPIIKKKFKSQYIQVQFQLLCSGLKEGKLVFLSVETYDDDLNNLREIEEEDYIKFVIPRDEEVISKIKKRASIFQNLKNAIEDASI